MKAGDIYYASWGYDQTNVDYYKVAAVHGKTMATLVPIGSKLVQDDGPTTHVVPDPDYIREWDVLLGDGASEGKRKRLSKHGCFSLRHTNAYPWNGKPKYETGYGYGH